MEVAWRSRPQLADPGLAFRHGDRNGVDLPTRTLRISIREAHRRIAIGGAVAPRFSLSGDEQPGRYAVVGDALRAGEQVVELLEDRQPEPRPAAHDLRGQEPSTVPGSTPYSRR